MGNIYEFDIYLSMNICLNLLKKNCALIFYKSDIALTEFNEIIMIMIIIKN